MSIPKNLDILVPWHAIEPASNKKQALLSAELRRELCPGHVLHESKAEAVAFRIDLDDVLFEVEGLSMPLAVVHLTWRPETHPQWPTTKLFEGWEQWAQDDMRPAHEEYIRRGK